MGGLEGIKNVSEVANWQWLISAKDQESLILYTVLSVSFTKCQHMQNL